MNTTNSYICRTGKQEYRMSESYGFRYVKVTAVNRPMTVLRAYATDRRYPYEEVAAFRSNDTFLNKLWERSLHTLRLNAEDGFMDCALREKAEWMGDGAVVEYPATRVLFGTRQKGIIKSDAGLIKNMILHIAQSLTDSGTVKAHHPSDRWDKHGYIEDYSCLWVHSLREVTEFTGDTRLLSDVWLAIKAQLNWFLSHRDSLTGLVFAREFLFMDNPVAYQFAQGATLNALLYQALEDAAFLAQKIKDNVSVLQYRNAARLLKDNYNKYLWIPDLRTFSAGLVDNRQLIPTAHAALMAISTGILSAEKAEGTKVFLLANYRNLGQKTKINEAGVFTPSAYDLSVKTNGINMTYTATWLLEFLFREKRSLEALTYIRDRWPSTMQDPQTGTLTESFGGGDLCHNFGAVPAYYMATKILGVNTILPVKQKMISIHPQPGDLTEADGSVVTEHGVVDVNWKRVHNEWLFTIGIPRGCIAQVSFPFEGEMPVLTINGKKIKTEISATEVSFKLRQGVYSGKLSENKPLISVLK